MQESTGYPTSTTKLPSEVFNKLTELPCGTQMNLEWFQTHVWSDTTKFTIPESQVICGMQANIYKIVLSNNAGDKHLSLIAKRVVPSELPSKASMELWQDFLDSVKREVDFYNTKTAKIPQLFPQIYYSHGFQDSKDVMKSFYLIIMSDVSDSYFQKTSMNEKQASDLMKTLAQFHAQFWLHQNTNSEDRGSFWVLSRRNPLKEIENADETWKAILSRFPEFRNLGLEDIEDLGKLLASKAQLLDDFVSQNLLTQIHGDCKGWNLFFAKNEASENQVLLIDMQWTGLGHPLQDVAYALTTSLDADLLHKMDQFLDVYIDNLSKELKFDTSYLKEHFEKVWLDYARVIMTGLWKRCSPENIEKHQNTIGPSMIGRSLLHAEFIIKKVYDLLVIRKIV